MIGGNMDRLTSRMTRLTIVAGDRGLTHPSLAPAGANFDVLIGTAMGCKVSTLAAYIGTE